MYCNCNGLKIYFLAVHREISKLLSKRAKLGTRFWPTGMLQSNTSGSVIQGCQCPITELLLSLGESSTMKLHPKSFFSTGFSEGTKGTETLIQVTHKFPLNFVFGRGSENTSLVLSLVTGLIEFTNTTLPLYSSDTARHKMMQQEANTSH